MAIYQVSTESLKPIAETTFGAEGILERKHLQALLRDNIGVLCDPGDKLMVIAEEFGDWVDSSRRIDLLCLDGEANLVVVELKRTEEGGHMELQALRYAAMVARMTFAQVVETYARFLNPGAPDGDAARSAICSFLGRDIEDTDFAPNEPRIILASGDFSKELTTCVLWLNDFSLDIRCLRLKLFKMEDGSLLLDVDQLIPLPETSEYQTQVGAKKQAEQQDLAARHLERIRFWEELLANPKSKETPHANRKPTKQYWLSGSIGKGGFSITYAVRQEDSQVELWIARGSGKAAQNKQAFAALAAQKQAIEKEFGAPLEWQELPGGNGCRIRYVISGGYRSPHEEWPALHDKLIDAMIRLDRAMRPRVANL